MQGGRVGQFGLTLEELAFGNRLGVGIQKF
jgi:hypothetical protein